VAADTADEAVALLRAMESETLLALDEEPEVELLDGDAGPLKGVLSMSARHYFSERDAD